MNILALDLATKTGWSTNIHGRRSGVIEFPVRRGESPGMRFLRCRAWLNEMWKLLGGQIDVICYEQAHHRGGAATACCVGLITEVEAFAAEHDIELMPVHTATLKKFSTGSGRASKQDMIKAAKKRGWNPQGDDEADACLLLEYAVVELNAMNQGNPWYYEQEIVKNDNNPLTSKNTEKIITGSSECSDVPKMCVGCEKYPAPKGRLICQEGL